MQLHSSFKLRLLLKVNQKVWKRSFLVKFPHLVSVWGKPPEDVITLLFGVLAEDSVGVLSVWESHLIWSSGLAVVKLIPVVDTLTGLESQCSNELGTREEDSEGFLFVLPLNNTATTTASKQKHLCSEGWCRGLDIKHRGILKLQMRMETSSFSCFVVC